MTRKNVFLTLILTLLVASGVYLLNSGEDSPAAQEESEVRAMVTEFGRKLQMVSLTAPKEIAAQAIEEHYSAFVSPALLSAWKEDPVKAPGRMTSGPWPDRIEILALEESEDGSYDVHGEVIEIAHQAGGATRETSKHQVVMKIRKQDGRRVITGFLKAL